jgi:hypothetical protein
VPPSSIVLTLLCCSLTLATIAYALVRRAGGPLPPDPGNAIRWLASPYRSPLPLAASVPDHAAPSAIVRFAAWSSFVYCCAVAPCLAFALVRLRLEALTPVAVVWMALALGHGWCARALIRDPARAAAEVRHMAQASLALGAPFLVVCTMHLLGVNPAEHDPCVPSLGVRLTFVLVSIAHAVLLLVAVRRSSQGRTVVP